MIKYVIALASLMGLLAGQAAAADLAAVPYAQVTPVAAPWTGFYVGLAGGWGRGTSRQESTVIGALDSGDFTQTGWIAGGTVGYNWQFGMFAVGVEGDISAADLDGNSSNATCGAFYPCRTRISWLHTGRGRVGVAFGQFMPYLTGGVAFAGLKAMNTFAENVQPNAVWGGVVGGGLEWMFLPQWSAKAEYLFVPSFSTSMPADFSPGKLTEHNISLVRFGLNYHFGWDGPVTARY
jgi:outer membrane immunogenic protein